MTKLVVLADSEIYRKFWVYSTRRHASYGSHYSSQRLTPWRIRSYGDSNYHTGNGGGSSLLESTVLCLSDGLPKIPYPLSFSPIIARYNLIKYLDGWSLSATAQD